MSVDQKIDIPGYDREENRMENLAIPLYELEQRTIKLETNFQTLSMNLSTKLINEMSLQINNNLKKYLPNIVEQLNYLKQAKQNADKWMEVMGTKFSDEIL